MCSSPQALLPFTNDLAMPVPRCIPVPPPVWLSLGFVGWGPLRALIISCGQRERGQLYFALLPDRLSPAVGLVGLSSSSSFLQLRRLSLTDKILLTWPDRIPHGCKSWFKVWPFDGSNACRNRVSPKIMCVVC